MTKEPEKEKSVEELIAELNSNGKKEKVTITLKGRPLEAVERVRGNRSTRETVECLILIGFKTLQEARKV